VSELRAIDAAYRIAAFAKDRNVSGSTEKQRRRAAWSPSAAPIVADVYELCAKAVLKALLAALAIQDAALQRLCASRHTTDPRT